MEKKATDTIDVRKLEISKDVKMKLYDENGLPIDGYDYYQHFAVISIF